MQGVVTFAAPTPGQADFYRAYGQLNGGKLIRNTHRFTHEFDIVPCMPPGAAWKDVGVRHMLWGGSFAAAEDEPYGLYITGTTRGNPPRSPNCEEEQRHLVERLDRYVDLGTEAVLDEVATPASTARSP